LLIEDLTAVKKLTKFDDGISRTLLSYEPRLMKWIQGYVVLGETREWVVREKGKR
jgi:hypothetical protein